MFHNNNYFLSRHGEAESNIKRILAHTVKSGENFPLTQYGIQQTILEAGSNTITFDYIIASPILRTRQTADIYQKNLGGIIYTDNRLIERSDGIFDGKSIDEYIAWSTEKERNLIIDAPENGETHIDVKNRVMNLFSELDMKYSQKNILIVSHGTPCMIIQKAWNGEDLPTKNDGMYFPKNKIIRL